MGPTARCNITVFQFLLKLLCFSSLRSISLLFSQKLPNFSISTSVFAISSLFAEISEIAQLSCTPCDIALPLRLSLSWIRLASSRASIFGCLLLSVCLSLASKSSWIASTREFQVRLTASYQNLLYRLTYTDLFGTYNWLVCQDIQKRLALLIPISKRMASDMKKRMLDLNRWPTRNSKGTQFQLAMTYVDTNLGRGWYKSRSRDGAMEEK